MVKSFERAGRASAASGLSAPTSARRAVVQSSVKRVLERVS